MLVQRGSAGNDVILAQIALQAVGYSEVNIDGIFGPITESAVVKFQSSDRRSPTGVVDDELYGRMQEIAGMLIVNRAQLGLPVVRTPYIPSIFTTNVPATVPIGPARIPTPTPIRTAAPVGTGMSITMMMAIAMLGATLYVVYTKRRA